MIILGIILSSIYLIYHMLTMFQQEHYDYIKLLKGYKTLYLKKIYMYILYILLIILLVNIRYLNILILPLGIISILIKPKYIIPLKITPRIIRLIITSVLIYLTIYIFTLNNLLLTILIILYPFIIYLINIINYPIETIIRSYYISKAKQKLKNNKNLTIITITGSFGKTTTKNILTHILEDKYITLSTPKSYNTIMGICKTINTSLNNLTEIFIAEVGANHTGEIKKIKKLLNPYISIITEIGPQHLSTFKTITNVFKAKLEIINFDNPSSITIVNNDNIYLKHLNIYNKILYKVGIKYNEDIYVLKKELKENIMKFTIMDNLEQVQISTKLLGIHNINNILLAYKTSRLLNMSKEEITNKIATLKPVENRLEYKQNNNLHIYNDSYNSNLIGFKNAIDLINNLNILKIIITPGIVDCGIEEEKQNTEIAKYISSSNIDKVYLIKNKVTKYYIENLSNYLIFNSFIEAYNHLINTYNKEEVCVLIENDLPDNYLER